jgi:hypothetical protein
MGGQRARAKTAVRVEQFGIAASDAQGGADIAISALIQMRLEEQALEFAAARVLLGFDVVKGNWLAWAEASQDSSCANSREARKRTRTRTGDCVIHIPTVLLP